MNNMLLRVLLAVVLVVIVGFFTKNTEIEETPKVEIHVNDDLQEPKYVAGVEEIVANFEIDDQDYVCEIAKNEFETHMASLDGIENDDLKQWYLEYKEMIARYSDRVDPPETIYDYFSADEIDILTHVIQAEIGDEYSFSQKCNVASVILNRLHHEKFADELNGILTESQFSTIRNGRYKNVTVSEDTILACEYVFEIGDTTGGALFFDSDGSLNYKFMFNDGAHNFYKRSKE